MKGPVLFIGVASILPILAWAASLVFHWLYFGKFFIWNEMAYVPLFILTVLLKPLYEGVGINSHAGVLGYTLLAALAYGALASLVLIPVILSRLKIRSGGNVGRKA